MQAEWLFHQEPSRKTLGIQGPKRCTITKSRAYNELWGPGSAKRLPEGSAAQKEQQMRALRSACLRGGLHKCARLFEG